jgi:hypothetical protein
MAHIKKQAPEGLRAFGSFIISKIQIQKIFIFLLPKKLIDDILIMLLIVEVTITQSSLYKEGKAIKT